MKFLDNFLIIYGYLEFVFMTTQRKKSNETECSKRVTDHSRGINALHWVIITDFLVGIVVYIEFIDSTGLNYIMFTHNSVALRN